jgi:hypothetical protein
MVRGPKKALKRLNAPKHWQLSKMGGVWAPKPAAGPHKQRECLPLSIILRNRLKYALTRKESQMIVMQKLVTIDGKVRTELNYPAGFMGESGSDESETQITEGRTQHGTRRPPARAGRSYGMQGTCVFGQPAGAPVGLAQLQQRRCFSTAFPRRTTTGVRKVPSRSSHTARHRPHAARSHRLCGVIDPSPVPEAVGAPAGAPHECQRQPLLALPLPSSHSSSFFSPVPCPLVPPSSPLSRRRR